MSCAFHAQASDTAKPSTVLVAITPNASAVTAKNVVTVLRFGAAFSTLNDGYLVITEPPSDILSYVVSKVVIRAFVLGFWGSSA